MKLTLKNLKRAEEVFAESRKLLEDGLIETTTMAIHKDFAVVTLSREIGTNDVDGDIFSFFFSENFLESSNESTFADFKELVKELRDGRQD